MVFLFSSDDYIIAVGFQWPTKGKYGRYVKDASSRYCRLIETLPLTIAARYHEQIALGS
jgi:hypothetical protein